jgi:hypothetical protein
MANVRQRGNHERTRRDAEEGNKEDTDPFGGKVVVRANDLYRKTSVGVWQCGGVECHFEAGQ